MKKSSYELLGQDPKWVKKLLFAGVFIQENKLHAIFDRYNEMTSKRSEERRVGKECRL